MELWQAILAHAEKEGEEERVTEADVEKLFEKECYKVIERIREIVSDDSLDDKSCFDKIENIVCLFEEMGSDGGGRHDFG